MSRKVRGGFGPSADEMPQWETSRQDRSSTAPSCSGSAATGREREAATDASSRMCRPQGLYITKTLALIGNVLKNREPLERVGGLPASRGSWTALCQGGFQVDSCSAQGVGLDGLVGPFRLHYSMIL